MVIFIVNTLRAACIASILHIHTADALLRENIPRGVYYSCMNIARAHNERPAQYPDLFVRIYTHTRARVFGSRDN